MSDLDSQGSVSPPPPEDIGEQSPTSMPPPKEKKKMKPKEAGPARAKGTTVLPVARVGRIIKADNEVDICSKEATFLISIATEQFIKHFAETGYMYAKAAKRKAVNYNDLSNAVEQRWHLGFLKEIVPTTMPLSAALAQRNRRQEASHLLEVGAVEDLLNRPDGTVDPHLKAFAESIQTHAHLGPGGKKLNKKGNPSANGATGEYVGEISGTSRTAGNGAGGESSEAQTSRSGRRIGRKSVGEEDGVGSAGNGNQSRDEDFEMNDESSSSLQAPPQVPQQQQPSVFQPPTSTTAPQQEAPSQNGNANSNAGTSSHLALPSSD